MKIFKYIILLLFTVNISLYGDIKETTNHLSFLKTLPKTCNINITHLLNNEDKYKAKLTSFNHKSGFMQYSIYEKNHNNISFNDKPFVIEFINQACRDEIIFNKNDETKWDKILQKYNIKNISGKDLNQKNQELNQDLDELENKYLSKDAEFKQVGDKIYLTTASYLLACLTFNETIIDIKQSLEQNKIVLKDNYTIYPNNNIKTTKTSIKTTRTGINPGSSIIPSKSIIVTTNHNVISIDSISEYLGENVILYIWDFRAKLDHVLLKIKTYIFALVMPFSLGFMGLSKVTKKISKINDFDDIAEKAILGAVILAFFYFTGAGNPTSNNKENIHLSHFQKYATTMFQKSMEFANDTANIFSSSYIDFKRKSAGYLSRVEINNIIKNQIELEKELEQLNGYAIMGNCKKDWNLKAVKLHFKLEDNILFPNKNRFDKFILNDEKIIKANGISQFYNKDKLNNNPSWEPTLLLSICGEQERRIKVIQKEILKNQALLSEVGKTQLEEKDRDQLFKIAKIQYHTTAEQGFLAIPQVAVTNIVTDNLNMFGSDISNTKLLNYQKETSKDDNLQSSSDDNLNILFSNLAYMMLPGAESVKNALSVKELVPDIFKIGKVLDSLIGTGATIYIMKQIVLYFPVIALSMASLMVISWYFVSAFSYFLVSPFVIIYLASQNQTDQIKSFLKKGVAISMKPILIILSVVITILAIGIIKDLSIVMFDKNFNLLIDIVKTQGNTPTSWFLMFLQGLLTIGTMAISLVTAFYLVFNGAEMLLDMLGFKDSGVDAKETIGGSVEAKTNKYNTPGA